MAVLGSIGGMARHLAKLRTAKEYEKILGWGKSVLKRTPIIGSPIYDALHGMKKGLKDFVAPQGLFEDLGLKYIGPVDGHNIADLEFAFQRARDFGKPFFVSFCNEMNGCWFPWSGCFYGGRDGGPEIFKKTWRHVVDRVRAKGADNILWVFHVNAFPAENDVWNMMASYYPGPGYVDWLGISVYGQQFRNDRAWAFFQDLIDWPLKELSAVDPKKPIMIAEFGVGEFPKSGNKAEWFADALAILPKQPRVQAAVIWHERWQNQDGSFSNLRINSSPAALKAFRQGIAAPEWIAAPPRP